MGDNAEHSLLSASGAPRWIRCYGSVALESTQPNNGNKYSAKGTCEHGLGAYLLDGQPNKVITAESLGAPENRTSHPKAADWIGATLEADGFSFEVDLEMAEAVQAYVDYCNSLGGVAFVETQVNYANWLGVDAELAWGTSDYITIYATEGVDLLEISIDEDGYVCDPDYAGARTGRLIMKAVDYKGGAGVAVSPRENEQAKLYLGGSLNEIGLVIEPLDTDIICAVIHQPRIGEGEPQEWYTTVGDLKRWLRGEAATAAAHAVKLHAPFAARQDHGPDAETLEDLMARTGIINELTPGEKQCRFCNAKAICPALTGLVIANTAEAFTDLSEQPDPSTLTLAEKFALIPLIQETIASWQEQTKMLLLANEPVGDLWLKKGKKGNREWINVEAAAKRMVRYVGTAMAYKPREPISPTKAEEMFKAKKLSAKQWAELQKLYDQAPGGPTIALPGEKGEPYVVPKPIEAFTDLTEDEDDLSYLA